MVNWIVIGFLILIVAILFIKLEHSTKRIKLIFLILFLAFFYFTASSVIRNSGIQLNSVEGVMKVGGMYLSWLTDWGGKAWDTGGQVVTIVGNAIKGNSTIR